MNPQGDNLFTNASPEVAELSGALEEAIEGEDEEKEILKRSTN